MFLKFLLKKKFIYHREPQQQMTINIEKPDHMGILPPHLQVLQVLKLLSVQPHHFSCCHQILQTLFFCWQAEQQPKLSNKKKFERKAMFSMIYYKDSANSNERKDLTAAWTGFFPLSTLAADFLTNELSDN